MKKVTLEPRGIQWTLATSLEDIDFADDISLLSHTQSHIEPNIRCRKQAWAKESKVMKINNRNKNKIRIWDEEIEEVESFCYLGSEVNNNGEIKEEGQSSFSF